jgi:V8-like Glu-specific endopeptidase
MVTAEQFTAPNTGGSVSNNHRVTARTRRTASALVGVALSAVTVLASSMPATAAGDGPRPDGHGTTARIPAGAVRATHGPEAAGWHGPAFQAPAARTRIVNGTTANSSDYPGVVGIQTFFQIWDGTQYEFFVGTCTGTVLTPTKILTAGHCATDTPNGMTDVIAGRNVLDNTSSGYVAKVSNVWTHQGFNLTELYSNDNATPQDDVAVLTLRSPLPAQYTPVTLTAQGDQTPYAANTDATIVGYGVTGTTAGDPGTLHVATVPIQSDATCLATAQADGATYDSGRMVCAGKAPTTPGGTDGIDTCFGDSGGPLFVGTTQAAITDWGPSTGCASSYGFYERLSNYNSVIMTDVNRTNMPVNLDFSGDGHSDLMYRKNTTGDLGLISGAGFMYSTPGLTGPMAWGGINDMFTYGSLGWNQYKKLFRVTNWNGDGTESIFAVKPTGELYQYKSDGEGNLVGGRLLIGTGFNAFADIAVTNSWFNDGRPNLMARTPTGVLKVYTSNGAGGWTNTHGTVIGSGWNMFNTVLTPGNWRGRGNSMIGRTASGDLRLYETNGTGGWLDGHGTLIGTGWNSLPTFISPGDWNGDNFVDLIGVSSTGQFKLFPTNGQGGWLNGRGIVMTGPAGSTNFAFWNRPDVTVF